MVLMEFAEPMLVAPPPVPMLVVNVPLSLIVDAPTWLNPPVLLMPDVVLTPETRRVLLIWLAPLRVVVPAPPKVDPKVAAPDIVVMGEVR